MTITELLPLLDSVHARGPYRWSAKCPAHADRSPSLSITEGDKGILLKCWAECTLDEICTVLGIQPKDLFYDRGVPRSRRPAPTPPRINRTALAFQFELGALDHRMRAEQIIATAKTLVFSTVSDEELDHALSHIGRAYRNIERAELYEHVSDSLRERDCTERISHERQERIA